jgi:hypothetical protein
MQHFPTNAAPLPFTPKTLATGKDGEPTFLVKPMTQADFDRLGFELFRHNVAPVTTDTFRATMIDEIFELYEEADAETKADLLDQFWQNEDLFNSQVEIWNMGEQDRLWDQGRGGPRRPAAPMPERNMHVRQRSKAMLLAEEIKSKSMRLRDLTIEMQSYEPRQREGITRLVLEGWTGFKTPFEKVNGIVPDDVYQALKAEIGKEALASLHTFVMSLGSVDENERGNSDSPLENGSDQTGSPEHSGDLAASAGTSPAAPAESTGPESTGNGSPTLESGSGEITDLSSTSTSAAAGESPNTEPTPTVEA